MIHRHTMGLAMLCLAVSASCSGTISPPGVGAGGSAGSSTAGASRNVGGSGADGAGSVKGGGGVGNGGDAGTSNQGQAGDPKGVAGAGGSGREAGAEGNSGSRPRDGGVDVGVGGNGGSKAGDSGVGASGAGGSSNRPDGSAGGQPSGACAMTSAKVRVTEIDVGGTVVVNEDEAALKPLVISPKPSGGARLAWMSNDNRVHITELDESDQVVGQAVSIPAHDYSDLYADDQGGVLLLTRDAQGDGEMHCGTLTNLCGATAKLPSTHACYDMYMVRFDGSDERWATQLTQSSSDHPPYLNSATDAQDVTFIWWYAHHGRIAFDGARWAGYYGAAISLSQTCVDADSALPTGVNIHQGDQMRIVDSSGKIQSGGFDWGCSHSGYERIVWDPGAKKFVTVCKTDNNNRIAFAPKITTLYPVDLPYSNLGNLVVAPNGGYWLTTSNIRSGQPAGANGLAELHLLHFSTGTVDKDVVLASDSGLNVRAPHLTAYGASRMLAAWETSTAKGDLAPNDKNRKLYVQILDSATGAADGAPLQLSVTGNRYQDFRTFPDGSVAYSAPGSSPSKVKIVRIAPCAAE